jgi:hypothetical protein
MASRLARRLSIALLVCVPRVDHDLARDERREIAR